MGLQSITSQGKLTMKLFIYGLLLGLVLSSTKRPGPIEETLEEFNYPPVKEDNKITIH